MAVGGLTAADCRARFDRYCEGGHYARRPVMVEARNGSYISFAAYQALAREAAAVVRALIDELERRPPRCPPA